MGVEEKKITYELSKSFELLYLKDLFVIIKTNFIKRLTYYDKGYIM